MDSLAPRPVRNRRRYSFAFFLSLLILIAGSNLLWSAMGRRGAVPAPKAPVTPVTTPPGAGAEKPSRAELGRLTVGFEENEGQAARPAQYVARGSGFQLSLQPTGAELRLRRAGQASLTDRAVERESGERSLRPSRTERGAIVDDVVAMQLVGGSVTARPTPVGLLETKTNYLVGRDRSKWRIGIENYAQVKYAQVYPDIDIVYHGDQGRLEYDFRLAPNADPSTIKLAFHGAQFIGLNANGDLALRLAGGEVTQSRPVAYQETKEGRRYVAAEFVALADGQYGFKLGDYDRTKQLVIDPILAYSTYLNFYSSAVNGGLALDAAGNSYVTGSDGQKVVVAKINAAGNAYVFNTVIGGDGGNGGDGGSAIAVDGAGNVYVSGNAYADDFPTVNAYQPTKASEPINIADSFVFKLNPTGTDLVFSTYLGGSGDEANYGLALDANGAVYVSGWTEDDSFGDPIPFPVHNPFQPTNGSTYDAYLAKFSATGSIAYASFLGGSDDDYALDVAVDPTGAAYVTGQTYSSNFPVLNPYQATPGSANGDIFISRVAPNGASVTYSSYLGGGAEDLAWGIALDQANNIFLTGFTRSSNFPTANPFQATSGSAANGRDVFVTKLNAAGSALVYSTYLGGSAAEEAADIKVDNSGAAYVIGFTASANFPLANPLQTTNSSSTDGFVTKLAPGGNTLDYSTYLGGAAGFGGGPGQGAPDYATGVALDNNGNAFIFGETYSTNFPLANPLEPTLTDYRGAFLTRLNEGGNQTFHTISGFVETNTGIRMSGVTLTLSGSQSGTAVTDATGVYIFNGLAAGGTYTITPPTGFDPAARTFTNLSDNQTLNFMRGPRSFHIRGQVTDLDGNGIPNVTMRFTADNYQVERPTDQDGKYQLLYVPGNRTMTVTPRHSSFSFTPVTRSFFLDADQLETNFVGVDNTGLSVELTAPAPGAGFDAPGSIAITANAVSTNSTVSKVEFFVNGNSIGSDTTAPYSINWDNVPSAQYVLSARVTDALGATKDSATVPIIVNAGANIISVEMTNPVNNSTLLGDRFIVLKANASSTNGAIVKVEFYEGTRLLGFDLSGSPYLLDYYLYAGVYDLTVVATDIAGAVQRSAPVHLTVRYNEGPSVTLTSPANSSVYEVGDTIPVTATASDPDGTIASVKFFVESNLIGTDTTAPYAATYTNATQGPKTIVAMATDNNGAVSYSNPIDIQVGNRPPSVVITAPSSQTQFTAPATITFSAQPFDPDGTVTKVEFFASGTLVGTDTTAPYSIQWTNVAAGNYDLVTKVTDDDGATAYSYYVFIRVFADVPQVTITSPIEGASLAAPATVTINVTASTADPNNPVHYVAFYADGRNIGFDSTAPYSMTWSNVLVGSYAITAVATDSQFAESTSAPVHVNVTGNLGNWQLQVPQIIGTSGDNLQDVAMVSAAEGWAVSGSGAIYHTTDGGHNWNLQQSHTTQQLNAISFFDAQRGVAVGNAPVYTTDGGQTWQNGTGMLGTFYAVDLVDANTAFAAGGGGIVMKSTDGGHNWTILSTPIISGNNLTGIDFVDASTGWAVGANGMVISTTNGGANWTIRNTGASAFFSGASFVNANEGWVAGGNVVMHTTNGGQSWAQQTVPGNTWIYDLHFINNQVGWGAGSQENIVFTNNGGQTWTTLRGGTGSPFIYPLWGVSFADTLHGIAVGNAAVISTSDGGQTWSGTANDFHTVSNRVFALDANHAWSANSQAEVLYTTNGGMQWGRAVLYTPTANSQVTDVVFTDAQHGWAAVTDGPPGFIYKTVNGGQTWVNAGAPATAALRSIAVVDSQTLVAAGDSGAILRSTNGGASWSTVTAPVTAGFRDLHFVDAANGWLVGTQGKILRTVNGGQTWTAQTSGLGTSATLLSVSFADGNNGWAAGGTDLLHTTDGGQTWSPQSTPEDATYRAVQAMSTSVAWLVGSRSVTDNYVAQTTDGGDSWLRENFNEDASFNTCFFVDADNGWVGGARSISSTEGRVYRRTGNSPTAVPLSVEMTSPANGAQFNGTPIAVAVSVASVEGEISQVDFYDGNTLIGTDTSAPYGFTWNNPAVGSHTITARASIVLQGDNIASFARPVTVAVTNAANVAPTVSLTSPSNNAAFGLGSGITLTATAADSDGTINRVDFYAGTVLIGTDTAAPFQTVWIGSVAGTFQMTAVATDNRGGTTTSTAIAVTVRQRTGNGTVADFDGDGKTDVSVFRPGSGDWYMIHSSDSSFHGLHWGATGDRPVPADFDGDGKTDIAVWRPNDGNWYILNSADSTFRAQPWGQNGDAPVAGDFDGDGKADVAVFRPSAGTYYILDSGTNAFRYQQWGANGDVPLLGDYDGDGKADCAVFRPSANTFYILNSSDSSVRSQTFGQSGDKALAADLDGDGRSDIAVFRQSNGAWYYLQSTDNSFRGVVWGLNGDAPAAGDYDGDGRWDLSVFRPSAGTFYTLRSGSNSLSAQPFGAAGDIPVAGAYVP